MSVMMIRPKLKADSVEAAEAAIKTMFAAIEQAKLEGARYASCKLADGVTFVVLLALDDGIDNPLAQTCLSVVPVRGQRHRVRSTARQCRLRPGSVDPMIKSPSFKCHRRSTIAGLGRPLGHVDLFGMLFLCGPTLRLGRRSARVRLRSS